MARQLREQYEGAFYHVRSRGNAEMDVFLDDGDRVRFLRHLSSTVQKHGLRCHAYCLMSNHYHLLLETPHGNLADGMKDLNGIYTQSFNFKHQRAGHVFEGRYRARAIKDEIDLLQVARYIVLNPVRAGLVQDPGAWRWSSYRTMCASDAGEAYLTESLILSYFVDAHESTREGYREFVLEGLSAETERKRRPPLVDLIPGEGSKQEIERAIYVAFVEHDYSQREIARYLGFHHSKVSKIISRVANECATGV
jgi:REP element-mobilizing transposase RayT